MKEIPGPRDNQTIVEFMSKLSGGAIQDDETAWCGGFTGFVLYSNDLPLPKNPLSARAYMELPKILTKPAYGSIVSFWRGSRSGWMGHVGFVVGKNKQNQLMVLSGNHNNMVDIAPFSMDPASPDYRVLGYRWPSIAPSPERYNLPVLDSRGQTVGGSES